MDVKLIALWDKNAKVWSASSDVIFGLFIEASSLDNLAEQLVITFTDLWSYSGKPLPPEVMFEVECIKKEMPHQSCNLNVHYVPQQLAAV